MYFKNYRNIPIVLTLFFSIFICCKKEEKNLPKLYKKFEKTGTKVKDIQVNKLNYREVDSIDLYKYSSIVLNGSKIIDSCWYVPLETNQTSILGSIDKILIKDNLIFILDFKSTGNLFVFNRNGEFKFKINNKGKGPNEYTVIRDFTIDSLKKCIVIYDDRLAKLFYFDFNGNFIDVEKTPFRFDDLCEFKGSMYYFLGNKENEHLPFLEEHYLINEQKGKFSGIDVKHKYNFDLSKFDQFYYSGEHLSFTIPIVSNCIFKINDNNISPVFQLNFGKKNINESIIQKLTRYTDYYKATKDLHFNMFLGTHFETKSKLFIQYIENGEYRNVFYNKNNKHCIVWDNFITDDKFSAGSIKSDYAIYKDDIFINIKEPSVFTNTLKNIDKINFKSNRVKELCKKLKETDNPVLCFYKLKEF